MAKTKVAEASPEVLAPVPCYDFNRYTCLELSRTSLHVRYIELDITDGLSVKQLGVTVFDGRYRPIVDYPAEQAFDHFRRIANYRGATPEAQKYLGITITPPKQEPEMPTTAKKEETPKSVSRAKVKGPPAKPVKGPPAKPVKKPMSTAQRFQELIMEGKLTDEQIFAKVQKEFDLDDGKKGYVKWYRNYLRKQGKNPPEPKVK